MYQKLSLVSLLFFLSFVSSACVVHAHGHTRPFYVGYSAPPPTQHRTVYVQHTRSQTHSHGYRGSAHYGGHSRAKHQARYAPPPRAHRPPRHTRPRYVYRPAPASNRHTARPARRHPARPYVAPRNHKRQKADKRKDEKRKNKKRHGRRFYRR
jgi:hypothetical protein